MYENTRLQSQNEKKENPLTKYLPATGSLLSQLTNQNQLGNQYQYPSNQQPKPTTLAKQPPAMNPKSQVANQQIQLVIKPKMPDFDTSVASDQNSKTTQQSNAAKKEHSPKNKITKDSPQSKSKLSSFEVKDNQLSTFQHPESIYTKSL